MTDAREARVDEAIAEFLLAAEAGRAPSVADLLTRYSDVVDDLRNFLADQSVFQQMTESLLGRGTRAVAAAETLPRRCGDFELLRLIGQGGMGRVYEARRGVDETHVAIKVLHPWLALDAVAGERLQREATAAIELKHPHVVPMLTTGISDGSPFLVMELIAGEPLDQVLRDRSRAAFADQRTIARGFADIADALEHAHRHGVIHRDVKPSNLLLTDDGRLLIGDFGLARLSHQPSLTRSGEAVGSPAYMSPEQIASSADGTTIDHRTDIYSLGATLYELLTGRPPFVADSREQLLACIRDDEPIAPRKLRPEFSRDLETICLKMLAKSPSERFETAADVAAELRRVADGERIHTRPPSALTCFRRWIVRRESSRFRAAIITTVILLALGLSIVLWQARQRAVAAQQQQAIDAALVVALTGDLKATEAAISRAEQVGVARDWLQLLRGQVAFHRGDYSAAIELLEPVSSSATPTVAAVSLLATAQLAAGSWEDYEMQLDRAESLTPRTAEDFLFQGQAEVYFDPDKAVRSLNAALRLRDTPLARLVRAEARANLAFDTNDLSAAESALSDAFIASDLLPDHPSGLLESLNAHVVAAELFGNAGHADRRVSELAKAETTFHALEAFGHLPTVIHNRALFLLLTDREPAAFELLQTAEAQHRDGLVAYDLALALFRRGDSAAAQRILQSRGTVDSLTADEAFLRVLLLQETGDPTAARAACDELSRRYQTGLTAYFRPSLLLLLGDSDAASLASRELRLVAKQPRLRGAFYSRLLAFNCGELLESELLTAAVNSRWDQCESLFFAALHRLSNGDRAAAQRLFERCVATRCAGFLSWDWSHAILQRWNTDPRWPAWIP